MINIRQCETRVKERELLSVMVRIKNLDRSEPSAHASSYVLGEKNVFFGDVINTVCLVATGGGFSSSLSSSRSPISGKDRTGSEWGENASDFNIVCWRCSPSSWLQWWPAWGGVSPPPRCWGSGQSSPPAGHSRSLAPWKCFAILKKKHDNNWKMGDLFFLAYTAGPEEVPSVLEHSVDVDDLSLPDGDEPAVSRVVVLQRSGHQDGIWAGYQSQGATLFLCCLRSATISSYTIQGQ